MRCRVERKLGSLILGFMVAIPLIAQQAPKAPEPRQEKRLLALLPPQETKEDLESGRRLSSRRPAFSSASSLLPVPQLLARAGDRADGAPEHRTLLRFRFSLSESYDDNILQRSRAISDSFTQFSPFIGIERLGRRSVTSLSYRGDGRAYRRQSDLNSFGHDLWFLQTYEGTHWSASFSHDLQYTPDPLSAFRIQAGQRAVNNLLGPDTSLVTPHTERLFNASTIELGYRKSERTSFSWAAGYRDARGRGTQFIDYNEVDLRVSYSYRHSPRGTLSIFPNVRLVRSARTFGDSKSYALFLGHSYQIKERLWVSFQGGPEYTQFEQSPSLGLPPELAGLVSLLGLPARDTRSLTSWAGGANVVYNRRRSAFGVSYSRGVTGSGGVAGPVRNETVSASVSKRLLGRWSSSLAASYSESRGFDALARSYDSVRASLRLERQLREAASFFVSYNFWRQVTDFSDLSFTRNSVTVGFTWGSRPVLLGR